jgi:hypothetical protein
MEWPPWRPIGKVKCARAAVFQLARETGRMSRGVPLLAAHGSPVGTGGQYHPVPTNKKLWAACPHSFFVTTGRNNRLVATNRVTMALLLLLSISVTAFSGSRLTYTW